MILLHPEYGAASKQPVSRYVPRIGSPTSLTFDGVSAMYFTYPIAPGIIRGAGIHGVTARASFLIARSQSSIAP
jgi:hypothetical protein